VKAAARARGVHDQAVRATERLGHVRVAVAHHAPERESESDLQIELAPIAFA